MHGSAHNSRQSNNSKSLLVLMEFHVQQGYAMSTPTFTATERGCSNGSLIRASHTQVVGFSRCMWKCMERNGKHTGY